MYVCCVRTPPRLCACGADTCCACASVYLRVYLCASARMILRVYVGGVGCSCAYVHVYEHVLLQCCIVVVLVVVVLTLTHLGPQSRFADELLGI